MSREWPGGLLAFIQSLSTHRVLWSYWTHSAAFSQAFYCRPVQPTALLLLPSSPIGRWMPFSLLCPLYRSSGCHSWWVWVCTLPHLVFWIGLRRVPSSVIGCSAHILWRSYVRIWRICRSMVVQSSPILSLLSLHVLSSFRMDCAPPQLLSGVV